MQPKITTLPIGRRDFLRGAILTGATGIALTAARRGSAFDPKRHFAGLKLRAPGSHFHGVLTTTKFMEQFRAACKIDEGT